MDGWARRNVYCAAFALVWALAGCSEGTAPTIAPSADGASLPAVASTMQARLQARVTPNGFARTAWGITQVAAATSESMCLWVADTAERRQRGLMHVTDLGAADGMVFVYPEPTTSRFWMKNTPLPLTIGFYDADGAFLDAFDMTPCTTANCPTYPTAANFVYAVEAPQGSTLASLMTTGSALVATDTGCDG